MCLAMINTSLVLSQGKGTLTKRNVTHYGCEISSITVKWSFKSLMGEPVRSGSYKWDAGYGADNDCLSYKDYVIIKVQSNSNSNAWVDINPTVPKAGHSYAYNTSGSPSWDDLFCGFNRYGRKID